MTQASNQSEMVDPIEVVGRIVSDPQYSPSEGRNHQRDGTGIEHFSAKAWVPWKANFQPNNPSIWHRWIHISAPCNLCRKRTFTGPDGRRYRWDMHSRGVVVGAHDEFRLDHVVPFVVSHLSLDGASRAELSHGITEQPSGLLENGGVPLWKLHPRQSTCWTSSWMDKERQQRSAAASGGGP